MAGQQFTPVQNVETVAFFKEFCATGDLSLETVGAVRGGEYVWALARINEEQIEVDGDTLENYLLIANSHCPGHSLVIKATMVRVGGYVMDASEKDIASFCCWVRCCL